MLFYTDVAYSKPVSNKTSTTTSDTTANTTKLPVNTPSNGTTSEPENGTSNITRENEIPVLKGYHRGMLERSLYVVSSILKCTVSCVSICRCRYVCMFSLLTDLEWF